MKGSSLLSSVHGSFKFFSASLPSLDLVPTPSRRCFLCSVALAIGISLLASGRLAIAGNLFVTDGFSNDIYEFTPSGTRTTFASVTDPFGLAFNSGGNLFVSAEPITGVIYAFTPNGTRSTFATGLSHPEGLAFNSSGNLFEASSGNIYEFTPNGTQSTFATGLQNPAGLVFDSSGNLFAADYGSGNIYEFTSNGTRSTFATGLQNPAGLAFNSSGGLFEADYGSGNIYEFTPNGTRSTFATGLNSPLYGPMWLAFDSSDDLFLASSSGEIYEFTPSGTQSTFATGLHPEGLTFAPTPEPSTFTLLAVGTIGIAVYAWRRRRQRSS